MTNRVAELLQKRMADQGGKYVFEGRSGTPLSVSHLDHLHAAARTTLRLPNEFVLHSLRHTCLTRLGAAGVDPFVIMKIAGHHSITMSQRYVHPDNASVQAAVEKLHIRNEHNRKALKAAGGA